MTGDVDRARDALFACNPACTREEWVRLATAAKAAGIDADTFHAWSAQAPSYKERDASAVWRSIKADGGITARTLFKIARESGWKPNGATAHHAPTDRATRTARRSSAVATWAHFKPATVDHPYIAAKKGKAEGVRVVPDDDPLTIAGQRVAGWLAVPMIPFGRTEPVSIQFIPPPGAGMKLNLPGAPVAGVFVIGDLTAGGTVYLCEGIGQAWACWKAAGSAAIVCFGWHRVRKIAEELRKHDPTARLIIVPDAGKEQAAEEIARDLQCQFVTLPAGQPDNFDVNDFALRDGVEALEVLLAKPCDPGPDDGDLEDLLKRVVHLPAGWNLVRPPPRRFILHPYIPRGYTSSLLGPGTSSKTLLVCEWTGSIITGSAWRDHHAEQGDVVIASWEDAMSDYHAKLFSMLEARPDLEPFADDFVRRLHFIELRGSDFRMVARDEHGRPCMTLLPDRLVRLIGRHFPKAVQLFVETVSRANASDETNEAMVEFVNAGEYIATRIDCSVTAVHHVSKAAALSGLMDAHAGRGGSALGDNSRATTVLALVTKDSDRSLWPPGFEAADFEGREIVLVDNSRTSYGRKAPRMHLERIYPSSETGAPFLRAIRPPIQDEGPKSDKDAETLMTWLLPNLDANGLTEQKIVDQRDVYGLSERHARAALDRLFRTGAVAMNVEKQYGTKGKDVTKYRLKPASGASDT